MQMEEYQTFRALSGVDILTIFCDAGLDLISPHVDCKCMSTSAVSWVGSTLWGMNHFLADVLSGKGSLLCCFHQICELGVMQLWKVFLWQRRGSPYLDFLS